MQSRFFSVEHAEVAQEIFCSIVQAEESKRHQTSRRLIENTFSGVQRTNATFLLTEDETELQCEEDMYSTHGLLNKTLSEV